MSRASACELLGAALSERGAHTKKDSKAEQSLTLWFDGRQIANLYFVDSPTYPGQAWAYLPKPIRVDEAIDAVTSDGGRQALVELLADRLVSG